MSISLIVVAVVVGIFSAILPLGPVSVLVVRRALAGERRGALYIGLGRIAPECLYCALASFGVLALLERFPDVRVGIEVLGALLLLAVGVWLGFQEPRAASMGEGEGADSERGDEDSDAAQTRRQRWGDWSGFLISLLNPALILNWSAAIALAVSMMRVEPSLLDKLLFPLGLGVGIGLGYVLLIEVLLRWGDALDDALLRWILRAMAVVFIGSGLAIGARLLVGA